MVRLLLQYMTCIGKLQSEQLKKKCQSYFVNNNLIEFIKSAYTKNHSTETAVLSFKEELHSSLDKRLVSLVALLHLSLAFDTIDDNILLLRLQHSFAFSITVLKWLCSYLSGHTQCMYIDNVFIYSGAKLLLRLFTERRVWPG